MPIADRDKPQWDIPFGHVGIAAMAIVGGVAYTFGEFAFYGFAFLPVLHLMGGWMVGLGVFAAAFGTLAESMIWSGQAGRTLRFARMWRTLPGAITAAGIVAALAIAGWIAHPQVQCIVVGLPVLGLVVFAGVITLQDAIVMTLRKAGWTAAAFAALLVLEAGMMFMTGEWLAIGDYRKGLDHFQKEGRAEWSIAGSEGVFFIDYARQDIVLRPNGGAGTPREIRRPLPAFACK